MDSEILNLARFVDAVSVLQYRLRTFERALITKTEVRSVRSPRFHLDTDVYSTQFEDWVDGYVGALWRLKVEHKPTLEYTVGLEWKGCRWFASYHVRTLDKNDLSKDVIVEKEFQVEPKLSAIVTTFTDGTIDQEIRTEILNFFSQDVECHEEVLDYFNLISQGDRRSRGALTRIQAAIKEA